MKSYLDLYQESLELNMLKWRIVGGLFLPFVSQGGSTSLWSLYDELKASISKQTWLLFIPEHGFYFSVSSYSMYVDFLRCTKTKQLSPNVHYDALVMPDLYVRQEIKRTAR